MLLGKGGGRSKRPVFLARAGGLPDRGLSGRNFGKPGLYRLQQPYG